ncbi:MAG: RluA family pseudouridine synthase [Alphaproteobacteria bacterium]|nr:MAG: RluA family pseudouridine synthase [Alphaproteobacteria bacterium]
MFIFLPHITVPKYFIGRLDRFLREQFKNLPQSLLEKSIRKKLILVNQKKEKSNHQVSDGNVITYPPSFEAFKAVSEKSKDLHLYQKFLKLVVYENEEFCVINKPYNIATQGGINVKYSINDMANASDKTYFLVHRLDKKTTGLLILAKNKLAANTLMHQFKNKEIQKYYVALTDKKPHPASGVTDLPLHDVPAKTRYRYIGKTENYHAILLKPYTGRKHQIRLHLAAIKIPIVGDDIYHGAHADRMYLHAYKLKIPYNNKSLTIKYNPQF